MCVREYFLFHERLRFRGLNKDKCFYQTIPNKLYLCHVISTIFMRKTKYTVTAALPYANGPLHLGHIAGVYLPADIFVRFMRMKKEDVVFVCGSDEHGAAITLRAKKENSTPQAIVDKYHAINKKAFADFNI